MKNYFKILLITVVIQIGCFVLGCFPAQADDLFELALCIWITGYAASIITDIVLAIRWGKNWKQKLLYIILMPTNYTGIVLWAAFMLWVRWVFIQIFG